MLKVILSLHQIFFQAEDGIRDQPRSRGLGDVYKRQSLATLSFDQRRSKFFTNELLILLKLIDTNQIDYKSLYGSWAGAFGFFQFMPSTIENYAIDYNNDNYIDLKNSQDSYASAANYLNNMGWNQETPCSVSYTHLTLPTKA